MKWSPSSGLQRNVATCFDISSSQAPGDQNLHDLVGAAIDTLHTGVAIHAGDRILVHVAVTAEQLQALIDDLALQIGTTAIASIERALALTIDYVKERKAFGKAIIDFQNTQFTLAELKTEATVARVFYNDCVARHVNGGLDATTASMAKYWLSDLQGKVVDQCLQLFGGYGFMNEYPIARMYRDARVQRIYGGTNEIMKLLIARSL